MQTKLKLLMLLTFSIFSTYVAYSQETEEINQENSQINETVAEPESNEIEFNESESTEPEVTQEAKESIKQETQPVPESKTEEKYKETENLTKVVKEEPKKLTEMELKQEYKHALGFAAGYLGGYGISYKYYFRPDLSMQITGFGLGQSDKDLTINFGSMITRALHTGSWESLFLSFASSIKREWYNDEYTPDYYYNDDDDDDGIDKTIYKSGILLGMQIYSSNIGLTGHLGSMFEHTKYYESDKNNFYALRPTIEISAHYYFK